MAKNKNKQNTSTKDYLEEARRFTHDLKAPLMILKGSFLENPAQLPSQDLVRRSVERLYEMSREYLSAFESCENASTRTLQSLNLSELKRTLKERLACVPHIAAQHGLHCVPRFYNYVGLQRLVEDSPHADFVVCGKTDLCRVIDNILLNAIEAMSIDREQHHIICTLHLEGSMLIVQIQDSGQGSTPEQIQHAFSQEFRSSKPHGKGIGLRSSRACVESWGAQFVVESAPQKGTIATLAFPLQRTPQNSEIN